MAADRAAVDSASVKVWDVPVRVLHWAIALCCVAGWVTTEVLQKWHQPVGYAALALVALRLVWGLTGSRYARLAQFVRGPRATLSYAKQVWRGTAPRYLGHNPLGGWMALALWGCVAALGMTGWLRTTDMFWGEPWVDLTHEVLAWVLIALVALHLVGVIYTGRKHRDALVKAMVFGAKNPDGQRDTE